MSQIMLMSPLWLISMDEEALLPWCESNQFKRISLDALIALFLLEPNVDLPKDKVAVYRLKPAARDPHSENTDSQNHSKPGRIAQCGVLQSTQAWVVEASGAFVTVFVSHRTWDLFWLFPIYFDGHRGGGSILGLRLEGTGRVTGTRISTEPLTSRTLFGTYIPHPTSSSIHWHPRPSIDIPVHPPTSPFIHRHPLLIGFNKRAEGRRGTANMAREREQRPTRPTPMLKPLPQPEKPPVPPLPSQLRRLEQRRAFSDNTVAETTSNHGPPIHIKTAKLKLPASLHDTNSNAISDTESVLTVNSENKPTLAKLAALDRALPPQPRTTIESWQAQNREGSPLDPNAAEPQLPVFTKPKEPLLKPDTKPSNPSFSNGPTPQPRGSWRKEPPQSLSTEPTSQMAGQPHRMYMHNRRGRIAANHSGGDRGLFRANDNWKQWVEVKVRVKYHSPRGLSTWSVYDTFQREGHITSIEVDKNKGEVYVIFRPPPERAFWEFRHAPFHVMLLSTNENKFKHRSPINRDHEYPDRITLKAKTLEFGVMHSPDAMMVTRSLSADRGDDIDFSLDLYKKQIVIKFAMSQKRAGGLVDCTSPFRFHIPFEQLTRIYEVDNAENARELIIPFESPPKYFRKTNDIKATHDPQSLEWREDRTWFRQTDIVDNPDTEMQNPVRLRKDNPFIDIGRWTTFRLVIHGSDNKKHEYDLARRALTDYNVAIINMPTFALVEKIEPRLWKLIDTEDGEGASSLAAFNTIHLAFPVRYQLEVCISHGYLNEHSFTVEFVDHLAKMDPSRAKSILEAVKDKETKFYNPMDIFNLPTKRSYTEKAKKLNNCVVYSAILTPSTIHYATPTVERSNRVIREYQYYEDRFLRVSFTDELREGKVYSGPYNQGTQEEVFKRISRTLKKGIIIGDRHYIFLGFGNSQFRENGAVFFAPTRDLTVERIRKWMGDFSAYRVIAKWAARLGQSFSTTIAFSGSKVKIETIPEIQRNGYTFSDGVGKISVFLAQMIAHQLVVPSPNEHYPSLFQFRLGGCKGVLAVDPKVPAKIVMIRKSQYKFAAVHEGLEIIRPSQYATANLNRQIILLLSYLGVPDGVFCGMLSSALKDMDLAMTDEDMAIQMLQTNIDHNQTTLKLASMVLDGFMAAQEPFALSCLQLWRSWNTKYLKEKAKIHIPKGAFLYACVDETATLRGHFNDLQPPFDAPKEEKIKNLPEIFLRIDDDINSAQRTYKVIEGVCILARNPSLHPGDVRIVRAVDVPALHHLRNVVVMPQTGDRDLANMCSGGDLDGDDFLIMWDPDLLPPHNMWNQEAMNFNPGPPLEINRPVTIEDVQDFFVTYMRNNRLATIAHAHLANGDAFGPDDSRCIELAELHSCAVDYPKSGRPAIIDRHLNPRQWPHFMEKRSRTYHSKTVLGKLYDMVELVKFQPQWEMPFDKRILEAYEEIDPAKLVRAAEIKELYDAAIKRIMAQHEIGSEFEVWTTFVLSHSRVKGDFKFYEEVGDLISVLRSHFRGLCEEAAGSKNFEDLAPFVTAMYTVTANEVAAALEETRQTKFVGGREVPVRKLDVKHMPMMSFPWLFDKELGKIANKGNENSLQRALARQAAKKKKSAKKPLGATTAEPGADDIVTKEGVAHRGDVLRLFNDAEIEAEISKMEFKDVEDEQAKEGAERSLIKKESIDGQLPPIVNEITPSEQNIAPSVSLAKGKETSTSFNIEPQPPQVLPQHDELHSAAVDAAIRDPDGNNSSILAASTSRPRRHHLSATERMQRAVETRDWDPTNKAVELMQRNNDQESDDEMEEMGESGGMEEGEKDEDTVADTHASLEMDLLNYDAPPPGGEAERDLVEYDDEDNSRDNAAEAVAKAASGDVRDGSIPSPSAYRMPTRPASISLGAAIQAVDGDEGEEENVLLSDDGSENAFERLQRLLE
ncbi:RdRP-domain-containing protein [Aulographum hederae CBS 113979]|uniref:RdRP-domain-containing protein n=1 Tax=Aulographum hederae CBS 113979 TaxID=1176131 RepID=A0A6G1GSQ2_9PEZI|nr:RdRP-domain-containing protein [Aulographum hederae CBS 113979]